MITFTLAGGCFWCLDAVYRRIRGVTNVVSGYSGGTVPDPTYEVVCTGMTHHAEAVQITFNESEIAPHVILDLFFLVHDPTTPDQQGNDIGSQYRSAMFWENNEQKKHFEDAITRAQKHWDNKIVTEISKLEKFYPAEDYHQDYFNQNPGNGYCSIVIAPKIAKVRKKYSEWFKEEK